MLWTKFKNNYLEEVKSKQKQAEVGKEQTLGIRTDKEALNGFLLLSLGLVSSLRKRKSE